MSTVLEGLYLLSPQKSADRTHHCPYHPTGLQVLNRQHCARGSGLSQPQRSEGVARHVRCYVFRVPSYFYRVPNASFRAPLMPSFTAGIPSIDRILCRTMLGCGQRGSKYGVARIVHINGLRADVDHWS